MEQPQHKNAAGRRPATGSAVPRVYGAAGLWPDAAGSGTDRGRGPGLVEYWRVLQRRKGTVILISVLGLLLAVLITLPMTPVYQAKALIEVQDVNDNFLNMKNVQQFGNVV